MSTDPSQPTNEEPEAVTYARYRVQLQKDDAKKNPPPKKEESDDKVIPIITNKGDSNEASSTTPGTTNKDKSSPSRKTSGKRSKKTSGEPDSRKQEPLAPTATDRTTLPRVMLPHRVASDILARVEDEREYQRQQGNKVRLQTITDEALHLGLTVMEKRRNKTQEKAPAANQ